MKKILVILSVLFAMSFNCSAYTTLTTYMSNFKSDDPKEMFIILDSYFNQKFDFDKFTQEEKVANIVELTTVDYYFENFEEPDSMVLLKYMMELYDYSDEDLKNEFFAHYDSVKNYSITLKSIYNTYVKD